MRRTLFISAIALLALSAAPVRSVQAQTISGPYSYCPANFAAITAAQIGGNTPLATGQLVVVATNAAQTPINFSVPSVGVILQKPWIVPVVNGAITHLLCLPRSDRTSTPVGYHFIVRDTSPSGGNRVVLDAPSIAILADFWSLDTYSFLPQPSPYTLQSNMAPFAGPVGPVGPPGQSATLVDSVTGTIYIVANGVLTPLSSATYKVLASTGGQLFQLRMFSATPTLVPLTSGSASTVTLIDQGTGNTYWTLTPDNNGGFSLQQTLSSTGAIAGLAVADTGDGITKLLSVTYGGLSISF
jgi:hypothetical protein